ncbi:MAG: porin [Burkholderiaceae bacterium]|nr:porin [Burkholderiaceae bacterium]
MKKSLFVLAISSLAAGTAAAQSSVTLFGIVDINARSTKNDGTGSLKSLSNGGYSSNRIGFRGVEDLGGGLSAGFWLESDINPDIGTTNPNGKFFARRSTLSLFSRFGELRMGRDLTPSGAFTYTFDPFGVIGVGGSANTARNRGQTTFFRSDNSVAYWLPSDLGGLYGTVMVAPGEGAANAKYSGVRLGFAAGPVDVAASYGQQDVVGGKFKSTGLAGSYNLGVVKLMAHYYIDKVISAEEKRWLVGATMPLGQHELRASYVRSDASGGTAVFNAQDANQIALGYAYHLSKRTNIYGTVATVDNKGTATFTVPGGPAGITPGGKSTGYEIGVRHVF